jgi:hypothetical protein
MRAIFKIIIFITVKHYVGIKSIFFILNYINILVYGHQRSLNSRSRKKMLL